MCPKVKKSGIQMASESGQTCPLFKWSISLAYVLWSETDPVFEWLKTRWPISPFENPTQIVSRK
jgi:hypothetical protein